MKIQTHRILAERALGFVKKDANRTLQLFFYKIGAVMPDIHPHLRFTAHHMIKKKSRVQRFYNRAIHTRSSLRFSYLCGLLAHYAADTFCRVHNDKNNHKPTMHRRYETQLNDHIKQNTGPNPPAFESNDAHIRFVDTFSHIETLYASYQPNHIHDHFSPESFDTDLRFSMQAIGRFLTELMVYRSPEHSYRKAHISTPAYGTD